METKNFLFSKAFWGAVLTIASTTGLLKIYGISFDPQTHVLSIALDTLFAKLLVAGIPGGAIISFWGRLVAKTGLRLR